MSDCCTNCERFGAHGGESFCPTCADAYNAGYVDAFCGRTRKTTEAADYVGPPYTLPDAGTRRGATPGHEWTREVSS